MRKTVQSFRKLIACLVISSLFFFSKSYSQVRNDRTGDTYPTISEAIAAAADHDKIMVGPGTYEEDILVNKPVSLIGAGMHQSIVKGVKSSVNPQAATFNITSDAVTIRGFTITRNGNNTKEWNDGLNTSGVAIEGARFVSVSDNVFTGNQVAVSLVNTEADSIVNNVIDTNRVGILLQGSLNYCFIEHNQITNNWTAGVVWGEQASGDMSSIYIRYNRIERNWYSQIENKSWLVDSKNFINNWLGSNPPTTAAVASSEPDYADQIPEGYGGSAVPPTSGAATVRGIDQQSLDAIVFAPYYTDATLTTLADVLSKPISTDPVVIGGATVTSEIPAGVTVTADGSWDGIINPPTAISSGDWIPPYGFQIGSTVIEVGSPYTTLFFSAPATLTLQGVTGPVGYKSAGGSTWTEITETCGGTYDNPSNPSFPRGECIISNGTDTKIITYHFTAFGNMIDLLPLRLTDPLPLKVKANMTGCRANNIVLPTPKMSNKYTVVELLNNAPSSYPLGETTVTWTAKDDRGNAANCSQVVIVESDLTAAIPSSFALPSGTDANTVYLGYAPATSITLVANAGAGAGNYTYLWSTGSTSSSLTVNPLTKTIYTCKITDAVGCSQSASRTINVRSVSCGNGKVYICHASNKTLVHDKSICVEERSVADHLSHGCKLGDCSSKVSSSSLNVARADIMLRPSTQALVVNAYPNPSSHDLKISIESVNVSDKVTIRVLDMYGRVVEVRHNLRAKQVVSLLNNYSPGVYFAEVIQAGQKRVVKLVRSSR